MQESTTIITKKVGDIWIFGGENERRGGHKNPQGQDCPGRSFLGVSFESSASYSGTVKRLTCRRVVPGWEHGVDLSNLSPRLGATGQASRAGESACPTFQQDTLDFRTGVWLLAGCFCFRLRW